MSFRINNNVTAASALRNVNQTADMFQKSLSRLSTGMRINSASDDPSGLVASEKMRSQIGGLDMAISNSQRATNMVKTAEGALDEVQSLLKQMRSLAVQSSNTGASDSTQLAANQAAAVNALASINRIAGNTSFGSIKLLDGSASQAASSNSSAIAAAAANGNVVNGDYRVSVTAAGNAGSASGQSAKASVMSAVDATIAAATSGAKLRIDDGAGNSFGITQPIDVDISAATSLAEVVSAINNDTTANKLVTASASSGRLVVTTKNVGSADAAGQFKVSALVDGAEDNTLAQALGFTDQTGVAHLTGSASPTANETRSIIAGASTATTFSTGLVSLSFASTTDFGGVDATTVSVNATSLNDVAAAINSSDIGSKVSARVEQLTATNSRLVLETKEGGTATNFSLTVNTAGGSGLSTGTGAAAQTGRVEGAATARSFASTALTVTIGAAATVGNGALSITTTTTSLDGLASALNGDDSFSKYYTAKVDSVNDTMGKLVIETKREGVTLSQLSIASGDAGTAAVTGLNATAAENIATGSTIDKRLNVSRLTGVNVADPFSTPLTSADTISFADVNTGGVMGISENVTVSLEGATNLQDVVNKINGDSTASKYVKASLTSDGKLQIDSQAAVSQSRATDLQVKTSSNLLARNLGITASTTSTDVSFTGKAATAGSDAKVMTDTQYSFKAQNNNGDLGPTVTFGIAKGTTIADAISKFSDFSKANGLGVSLSFGTDGTMAVTNNDIGTNRGVQVDVASGSNDALGIGNTFTGSGAVDSTYANKYARSSVGQNMSVSVNGKDIASADINGSKVMVSSASTAIAAAQGLSFSVASSTKSGDKGSVTVSGQGLNFQIGANAGETASLQIASAMTGKLGDGVVTGKTLADIDLTTFSGAQDAISIIDKALDQISNQRASIGAFQSNTLEAGSRNLAVAKENLQAAESQIRDIDVASEMTNFTKLQILQQTGMAMLAQANSAPQSVLSLLR